MIRILDRYLVREIALPLLIGLVAFTFILELPPILIQGEQLISRGVEWPIVARLLLTLLPQALCLTIPMAVLLGILVGCSRLSGDREFVAMQACGVSLLRLARPALFVAAVGTAATAYETIVALPNANQTYREIVYVVMAERVENSIKPRVFFEQFPDKVIFVKELPAEGGWRDVFLADTSRPPQTTVYFAEEGRIRLDREHRIVQLELLNGTSHTTHADKPDDYEETTFDSTRITLDPATVFPRPPAKGAREMTYAELREEIAEASTRNDPAYEARFMMQQKLSLPLTCPILALIGLALGTTNRKDAKFASFAVGMAVIVVYYVFLWGARAAAMGGRFPPEWAPWTPNIVMGVVAAVMVIRRLRKADQPIRLTLPAFLRDRLEGMARKSDSPTAPKPPRPPVYVIRLPHLDLPMPKLLDLYVSREYLKVLVLGIVSLLALFYIFTFIDLIDKLFRGEATSAMLLRFFYFRTPQFVFYVIPMGVLVASLVTIGVMTKSSELLVMRACGVSLYRAAMPVLFFAFLASGALFVMQEWILVPANQEADQLERTIRRWPSATTAVNRRWIVGTGGEIYHYDMFDPQANRFLNLFVYRLDNDAWRLREVTRVNDATIERRQAGDGRIDEVWVGRQGWLRELGDEALKAPEKRAVKYEPFTERALTLEPASYFKTLEPLPELMTYVQLRDYINRLQASGANVVPQMVALQRKIAFPFVTVILAVLAVPFAVTTGSRGAMYGVGVGMGLALTYWVMMSVSGALGAGGVLPPALAAWTPNILFGAAALYLVLTVRT